MENAVRYHAEIDLSQKETSHAQLIRLTGRNKNVLEVGPATGYVTKLLQQRGCRVSCIEIDPEAADAAAEFCERMVVANIETMDLTSTFPDEQFDVVTFGDVLEHLVDPLGVLVRVKNILKPRGYVVASVPNVAHGSIRLSLLAGRFDYLEAGLLDRTHLRFFTQESLGKLFVDAGYAVKSWRRVLADPFVTEIEIREADYPAYLSGATRGDLEALTYQFVVRAAPASPAVNGRTYTSPPVGSGTNVVAGLWEHQRELQAREAALDQANAALAGREAFLEQTENSLREVTAELAAINGSTGYRILRSYRRGMRRLLPEHSWRGRAYGRLMSLAGRLAGSGKTGRAPHDSTPRTDGIKDASREH